MPRHRAGYVQAVSVSLMLTYSISSYLYNTETTIENGYDQSCGIYAIVPTRSTVNQETPYLHNSSPGDIKQTRLVKRNICPLWALLFPLTNIDSAVDKFTPNAPVLLLSCTTTANISGCPAVRLFDCSTVRLSDYLSCYLSDWQSGRPFVCLSGCLDVWQPGYIPPFTENAIQPDPGILTETR